MSGRGQERHALIFGLDTHNNALTVFEEYQLQNSLRSVVCACMKQCLCGIMSASYAATAEK